jgi:type VI secretion system protein ImpM
MSSANFPAGCFGKLPTYGDFIRHNAASREALDFDKWIQEGLHCLRGRFKGFTPDWWELVFKNAPSYHFLFHPAESADTFLVGILKPSQDESDRKYPFLVFTQVDRRRFGDNIKLAPLAFAAFFGRAREFMDEAERGLTLQDFPNRLANMGTPLPIDWKRLADRYYRQLSDTRLEDFFMRLFGDFEDERKYLLFKNLRETLQPSPPTSLRPAYHRITVGLRFPLSTQIEHVAYETGFWIQATLRLLEDPPVTPILFWTAPREKQPAHLFFFLRRPSPRQFESLVDTTLPSDILCKLDRDGLDQKAKAASALPPAYREMLERPRMNLQEALMKL